MREQPVRFVLLAIWFGLLTGFVEVGLLGIKKFYLGKFIRFGADVIWMGPLADAILFLILGMILYLFAYWRPKLVSPQVVISVFGFLSFLSLLFMYYPLHVYAKVLLAAGLAVQASRLIGRRSDSFQNLVRRTMPWMATVVIVLAVSAYGWRWMGVQHAVAQLPRSAADAPNVLLIVLDTVRAENLSLYGYHRKTTPNLEHWARSGVVFDRAIATSPWTLPSHASIFTGRWPHELSTNWESALDNTYVTLAEALSAQGYITAGFVANTHYCGYEFGLDRGFVRYEDYVVSPQELLVSSSLGRTLVNHAWVRRAVGYYDNITRKDAAALNQHFLGWLARSEHRPFFAFLNYFDAHEPYLPPRPFAEKFGPALPRENHLLIQDLRRSLRQDWFKRPPAEIKIELDSYDGAIAYIDHQLHRLFSELEKKGLLENTIIIVTSDHGEQFGEHGLFLHGNSLYQPLLRVPLVISFPARLPAGGRVAIPVSLRELPATVVDLIGLRGENPFPGSSLARYWSADDSMGKPAAGTVLAEVRRAPWGEDWYPTVKGDMHSLYDERYHYIKNGDGREELYDIERDSREEKDLTRSDASERLLKRFRSSLKTVFVRDQASD